MINSVKYISFNSPKGGVGRTLSLINVANIYSKGSNWAGIQKSNLLLVDLDFQAPGIQFYNLLEENNKNSFLSCENSKYTYIEYLNLLQNNNLGLLFLLNEITDNPNFSKFMDGISNNTNSKKTQGKDDFEEYKIKISSFLKLQKINIYKHIVECNRPENGSIYILPAGSPNNRNYSNLVFNFDWLVFVNNQSGVFLLEFLIQQITEYIDKKNSFKNPIRVIFDQQAGLSIPSAISKTISDASVIVGGFNEQNKSGLTSLVSNYCKIYSENFPWIILNQYNLRNLTFDYSSVPTLQKSPYSNFKTQDETERVNYINRILEISKKQTDRNKIFITEFNNKAIQKEHLYQFDDISSYELNRLIVAIENNFIGNNKVENNLKKEENVVGQFQKIYVLGEKIKFDSNYSGPLFGLYNCLKNAFPYSEIIALTAKHEDIVNLIQVKDCNAFINLKHNDNDVLVSKISELKSGIYDIEINNSSNISLSINDLDFISYPYHISIDLNNKDIIVEYNQDDFYKQIEVSDSITKLSESYFNENIIRWQTYSSNENGKITGVPLFLTPQLLAYKDDFFSNNEEFNKEYRKEFHREFNGFKSPDDLLNFAIITNSHKEDKWKSIFLSSNSNDIALWYEWQTIFSLFYYDKISNPINSKAEYKEFLKSVEARDAEKMYLRFFESCNTSQNSDELDYDWDKLIDNFYLKENSSLIFLWPDSIPLNKRKDDTYIYQLPPAFNLFEECWKLSIVKKDDDQFLEVKTDFLNKFCTPEYQLIYLENGGLPIHKATISSLDNWAKFPFIPSIWQAFFEKSFKNKLVKRDSFKGFFNTAILTIKNKVTT